MSIIYDPEYRILIECLKDHRSQSKMTQAELAGILGCSTKTITRWRKANKLTPKCFSIGKYCYFIQDVYEFFINSRIN